ncbi:MAG: protein kinase domain-containing protein [Anaerolineales bacterium]
MDADTLIGQQIGSYEILEQVGIGGMARVYKARQISMDRLVALKIIDADIAQNTNALERFQREALLVARLEHPHILPVYDFNSSHVPPYIVMRYLETGTLNDVLLRGPMPAGDIAFLFRQIGQAVDYAHREGVIHRDLKPSNIMLDSEGNAFVVDFGVARMVNRESAWSGERSDLTGEGIAVGTPDYMAPEQALGESTVNHRADIYAMGVLLFQLTTGRLPYVAANPMGVIIKHLKEDIPSARELNPALSHKLDALLQYAMAKNPDDRPASAALFAEQAAEALLGEPDSMSDIRLDMEEAAAQAWIGAEVRVDPTSERQHDTTATAQKHGVLTILRADVSGLRGPARDVFWRSVHERVGPYEGHIVSARGDDFLAVWGLHAMHKDDPQHAANLAMELLRAVNTVDTQDVELSLGLVMGSVMVLQNLQGDILDISGEGMELAQAFLARRVPGLVVSHEVFLHLRAKVDFEAAPPVRLADERKFLAYRVRYAHTSAFSTDGSYTDEPAPPSDDLRALQDAYRRADNGTTTIITIVSESNGQRSSLLSSFFEWTAAEDAAYLHVLGRAVPAGRHRPYALVGDLLDNLLGLARDAELDILRAQLEHRIGFLLNAPSGLMAHLIGYVIGYELESPYVRALRHDPEGLFERAEDGILRVLHAVAARGMVIIQLEDIQWADDASVDIFTELARRHADLKLLVLCRRDHPAQGQLADAAR